MAFTKQELETKLLAKYAEQNIQGELAGLVAGILSEYLYLHQMEDVSILMEDSFLRSKLLSSRIQHAADNFFSVDRGRNRIIHINNLGCLSKVDVKKFDTISTYGQYKLIYAKDYLHEDLNLPFEFDAYLSTDIAQVYTVQGNGKYYIDIEDGNGNLVQNISEDIQVMSLDDRGTQDNSDDEYHVFKVTNVLNDLYTKDGSVGNDNSNTEINVYKAEICAMTLPGYGVRLWKKDKFQENFTYTVKYLKSPDEKKPEINIQTAIRTIPGFTKNVPTNSLTEFTVVNPQTFKETDVDKIYLLAASNQRFRGEMKSLTSIEEEIRKNFPSPIINGFNVVVGPKDVPQVDNGKISVYYVGTGEADKLTEAFEEVLRQYNVTEEINFEEASAIPMQTSSPSSETSPTLHIEIYYRDLIDYAVCSGIVESYKNVVGKDFNPYQIIADLMSNEILQGKITLVNVYNSDSSNNKTYPPVTTLNANECIKFTTNIQYISQY